MNWNNLKAFVTGGAGFNGSSLVDALVKLSADATVLDNLSDRLRENLANLLGDMTFIGGDVRNPDAIRKTRRLFGKWMDRWIFDSNKESMLQREMT